MSSEWNETCSQAPCNRTKVEPLGALEVLGYDGLLKEAKRLTAELTAANERANTLQRERDELLKAMSVLNSASIEKRGPVWMVWSGGSGFGVTLLGAAKAAIKANEASQHGCRCDEFDAPETRDLLDKATARVNEINSMKERARQNILRERDEMSTQLRTAVERIAELEIQMKALYAQVATAERIGAIEALEKTRCYCVNDAQCIHTCSRCKNLANLRKENETNQLKRNT